MPIFLMMRRILIIGFCAGCLAFGVVAIIRSLNTGNVDRSTFMPCYKLGALYCSFDKNIFAEPKSEAFNL